MKWTQVQKKQSKQKKKKRVFSPAMSILYFSFVMSFLFYLGRWIFMIFFLLKTSFLANMIKQKHTLLCIHRTTIFLLYYVNT